MPARQIFSDEIKSSKKVTRNRDLVKGSYGDDWATEILSLQVGTTSLRGITRVLLLFGIIIMSKNGDSTTHQGRCQEKNLIPKNLDCRSRDPKGGVCIHIHRSINKLKLVSISAHLPASCTYVHTPVHVFTYPHLRVHVYLCTPTGLDRYIFIYWSLAL